MLCSDLLRRYDLIDGWDLITLAFCCRLLNCFKETTDFSLRKRLWLKHLLHFVKHLFLWPSLQVSVEWRVGLRISACWTKVIATATPALWWLLLGTLSLEYIVPICWRRRFHFRIHSVCGRPSIRVTLYIQRAQLSSLSQGETEKEDFIIIRRFVYILFLPVQMRNDHMEQQ